MNVRINRTRWSWWGYLLLGLVWMELTLQVVAVGYRWGAGRLRNGDAKVDAELTILCLGDSMTFGSGADAQHSYPRQLERLLQQRWPERDFRVINAGKPGFNSSQVLHRLPAQLRELHPDLVLLMIGGSDTINFREVDRAEIQGADVSWPHRLQFFLKQGLSHLRLYRLGAFVFRSLPAAEQGADVDYASNDRQRSEEAGSRPLPNQPSEWVEDAEGLEDASEALWAQAETYMEQRQFAQAQHAWERVIAQEPARADAYVQLARAQVSHGAFDEALTTARAALTFEANAVEAYMILGEAFSGQHHWEQAQAMYQRAVELEPSHDWAWFWYASTSEQVGQIALSRQLWGEAFRRSYNQNALANLGRSYPDAHEGREAMRILLDEVEASADQDAAFWQPYEHLVSSGTHESVGEQLVEHNLERIVSLVTTHGVQLGIVTYPNHPGDKWMNRAMREVAVRHPSVLFVDAAESLWSVFESAGAELTGSDGWHPNAQGYALFARYVVDALVAWEELEVPARGADSERAEYPIGAVDG